MPGRCVRGDVVQVSLDPAQGSEIKKTRPCVVVQNNTGNKYSPVTIVLALTDAENVPTDYPMNVRISKGEGGIEKDSVILGNQIRSIDERRILKTYGRLSAATMKKVDAALKRSLGLD